MTQYFGKYRGVVRNNIDVMQQGRLLVNIPSIHGSIGMDWAMPCMPFAGIQSGCYMVPPINAGVWVEFEEGDPSKPIWSGCWWGSASEVPALALAGNPASPNVCIQTTGQNTILISDLPGGPGITLKTTTGAMFVINDTGILISNGKGATIALTGPTVTINAGALVVT